MRAQFTIVLTLPLLLTAGCATRPDWIQSTLVTADVTGTWRGTITGTSHSFPIVLVLEQHGPKVTGRFGSTFGGPTAQGGTVAALEGSVEGDVFRFAQPFGAVKGEATVAGDEMTGQF